tara:strand:+ start:533 stop:1117 length:585 start_codon:yes stop_codon:yes gene_type:complete
MRRLGSKYKEGKRKKRNQVIVGIILIFVMFSSVLGFAFSNFSSSGGGDINSHNFNSINYNGFDFIEQENFWILNQDGINFIFRYNPNQVPRIASEIKDLESYQGKILYMSSEDVLAESEIRTNLLQFTDGIEHACLEECGEGIQIKTCQDNFIVIREGNRSITQEDNCIFIEGEKEDLIKLADEFLFKLIKVEN